MGCSISVAENIVIYSAEYCNSALIDWRLLFTLIENLKHIVIAIVTITKIMEIYASSFLS